MDLRASYFSADKSQRQLAVRQLAHDVRDICRRNPQGGYRMQIDRKRTLLLCAEQLCAKGIQRKLATNLDVMDIRVLVDKWQADKLAPSTIRFRLHCLHWLARKIGKPHIVGPDRSYGVGRGYTP